MTELSKRYEVVGALTYYLYDYGMIEPEKIYTVVQGEKMQRPSKISTQLILMFKNLNEFFAEIKQEAAEFAESFRSNPRMLEAHMNDIKNRLSAKMSDMFGIEYHYTISSVDFFRGGEVAHAQGREYLCGNPQGERPEPSGAQACAPETGTGGRIIIRRVCRWSVQPDKNHIMPGIAARRLHAFSSRRPRQHLFLPP